MLVLGWEEESRALHHTLAYTFPYNERRGGGKNYLGHGSSGGIIIIIKRDMFYTHTVTQPGSIL